MRLVTKSATASTTEASYELSADKVIFVKNDDTTNDLYISFVGSTASNPYLIVKAGESFTFTREDDIRAHTIYYKSSASTVAFRVVGLKD